MQRNPSAGRVQATGRVASSGRLSKDSPFTLGSALLGWIAPDQTALLTLVGGNTVQAIADACPAANVWTAASSSQRPGYVTNGTGGKPYLTTSTANNTKLSTLTGGVTGQMAHGMWSLVEIPAGTQLGSLIGMGQPEVSPFNLKNNHIIGQFNATTLWGGGCLQAAPVGYTADGVLHSVSIDYDGSSILWLYVDGQPISGASSVTFSLLNGSGIFPYQNQTPVINANIYQTMFIDGSALYSGSTRLRGPTSNAWLLDLYMTKINPALIKPSYITCIGDSTTAASNLSVGNAITQSYPARLQVHLLSDHNVTAIVNKFGNPGYRSDQILAACPLAFSNTATFCDLNWSPINQNRVAIIWEGINDYLNYVAIYGSVSAAVTGIMANLNSLIALERTAGALRVCVMNLYKTSSTVGNGNLESIRTQVNTAIAALTNISFIDVASLSQFSNPSDTTYYDADGIHLSAGGYDVIAQTVSNKIYSIV